MPLPFGLSQAVCNGNQRAWIETQPQVRAAQAELLAAGASLDEARLHLSRTEIRAPFTGRVRTAELDVGQYLNANQPAARIYSIERAEIVVPVADEDMAFFTLPGPLSTDVVAAIDRERIVLLTGTDERPRSVRPGRGHRDDRMAGAVGRARGPGHGPVRGPWSEHACPAEPATSASS